MVFKLINRLAQILGARGHSQPSGASNGAVAARSAELFEAIASNNPELIKLAVAAGVPVNGKRADGVTPLTFACSHFAVEAVRTLLELGADPDLPSNDNWLPEDYAQNNTDIDLLLREARQRPERLLPKIAASVRSYLGRRQISLISLMRPTCSYLKGGCKTSGAG